MYFLECQELFRAAISQVMKGLPTELAKNAVSCAEKLLEWMGMNRDEEAMIVASSLIMDLGFDESKSPRVN